MTTKEIPKAGTLIRVSAAAVVNALQDGTPLHHLDYQVEDRDRREEGVTFPLRVSVSYVANPGSFRLLDGRQRLRACAAIGTDVVLEVI